jgi:hypothetical protein
MCRKSGLRRRLRGQSGERAGGDPAVLAGTGIAIWHYPLGGAWLVLALGLYAVVLWRYPAFCLPAVLALLPLLDFSLWSGWILLNEFDSLIA